MQFICIFFKYFYLNFSFDKAIKINSKNSNYWYGKGITFYNLNKYEQALEWLTFSL